MVSLFTNLFNDLKYFDNLSDKANKYQLLINIIEYYNINKDNFTINERTILAYILSERAYNQGYIMASDKAYEMSGLDYYFFEKALEIYQLVPGYLDARYIKYQKAAKG